MESLRLTEEQVDIITDALACYAVDCHEIGDGLTEQLATEVLTEVVQQTRTFDRRLNAQHLPTKYTVRWYDPELFLHVELIESFRSLEDIADTYYRGFDVESVELGWQ